MTLTRRNLLQGAAAGLLLPMAARWSDAIAQTDQPTLGAVRAVTITAADLAVAGEAWTKFMGYWLVRRGRLSAATARILCAPALVVALYTILGLASEEEFSLRFVVDV